LIRNVYSELLYVGNALDARDLKAIYDKQISAVVDLAINEPPAQLGREIIYCRFPLNDGGGNNDGLIAIAVRTIAAMIQNKTRTIVACSAGMSRAPTIAAASVALMTGRDPDECLVDIISNAPNDVSPILWAQIKRVYNTG
jgi:protein-tyrosine phosphatase